MSPTGPEGKCIVRYRSVERRVSLSPLAILAFGFTALALGAACSDDAGGGQSPNAETTTTALDPNAPTTLRLDTPTTFILDCAQMPSAAALSAIVGIPLADGQVIGSGTCQFLGLNDQTRVITLGLLTDPGDLAAFNDVEAALGAATPLNDPTLVGAVVDPSSLVWVFVNGGVYSVRTLITDATPAEQVPLSVAVLHAWLGV